MTIRSDVGVSTVTPTDDTQESGEVADDELRSLEADQMSEIFDEDAFPTTTEALISEFGDVELAHPMGTEPLRDVLEASGAETYESADEAQLAVLNGVSRDAVGRPRYSDRGDSPHSEDEFARQQESL